MLQKVPILFSVMLHIDRWRIISTLPLWFDMKTVGKLSGTLCVRVSLRRFGFRTEEPNGGKSTQRRWPRPRRSRTRRPRGWRAARTTRTKTTTTTSPWIRTRTMKRSHSYWRNTNRARRCCCTLQRTTALNSRRHFYILWWNRDGLSERDASGFHPRIKWFFNFFFLMFIFCTLTETLMVSDKVRRRTNILWLHSENTDSAERTKLVNIKRELYPIEMISCE